MTPEQIVGERVELLHHAAKRDNPKQVYIPRGSIGTVMDWEDDAFEIMFIVGMDLRMLHLTPAEFAVLTVPCEMEKRLT